MKQRITHLGIFSLCRSLSLFTVLLTLAASVCDLGLRSLTGSVIDLLTNGSVPHRTWLCITLCAVILVFSKFLQPQIHEVLEARIRQSLYTLLEQTALGSQVSRLETVTPGDAGTYYTADINGILQYVRRMLNFLFPDVIIFTAALVVIARIHWILGITAILSSILQVLIMNRMSKKLTMDNSAYQQQMSQVNHTISESLYNNEFTKAANMEDACSEILSSQLRTLHDLRRKQSLHEALLSAPTLFSAFFTILVMALSGGYLASRSIITVGSLFTIITVTDFIVSPVMRFENSIKQIRRASAHLTRIREFLSIPSEPLSTEHIDEDNHLETRNLSFGYTPDAPIFRNLNLTFSPGQLHCLVGSNGTGKSTLLKLLSACYAPQDGGICMPSFPDPQEIRRNLVFHTQETVLLPDTIYQNLTMGAVIPDEDIHQICRIVGIDEEIRLLPDAYNTRLRTDGEPLSGGQKQRLCLARSFLRQAPVYILDEPTVGIGAAAIRNIIAYLKQLSKNHLVLVITHEPLLIQSADTITNLEEVSVHEE